MDHHTLSYHHLVTTTKPNFPFRLQPTFLAHHYHHSISFIPFAYLFQTLEHSPGPPLPALLSPFTFPHFTAHTIITMISPSIAQFHLLYYSLPSTHYLVASHPTGVADWRGCLVSFCDLRAICFPHFHIFTMGILFTLAISFAPFSTFLT
jgi:hypothetical protein